MASTLSALIIFAILAWIVKWIATSYGPLATNS